ncbi:alpha/beta fold hydrolase [Jeotgalibacillus soli]|uniref:Alpha/beta hydrolase n=1 Tax=Jeotgalibacillus soli TaxID=889306 RepID=A0A0C2VHE7_9BACL|nr:hypothetical protein [Jeotgalibacillus soli]KIL48297.1 hypothetical protein KP78_17440 [Jeotgalibacillus soli]
MAGPEDGAPLILFHGFRFGAIMWYLKAAKLNADFQFFAIDNLGEFNKSTSSKSFVENNNSWQ